jgi:peptidoglycan/LPS O-acetylase OafA/YrhL
VTENISLVAKRQVLAIDLLRFIAAMLVVTYHFGTMATRAPDIRMPAFVDRSLLPTGLSPLTDFGWVGVEIFFVISGYVIAISAQRSTAMDFLRRRYLRLAPAAWVCATITFTLLLIATGFSRQALLAEWLRTVALWTTGATIDPSYWTISIEITFYAIVATQLRGGDRTRRLNMLAIVIGFVSTTFALLVQFGVTDPQPAYYWQLLLVQHGCFFSLGMMVRTSQTQGWSRRRVAFCSLQTLVGLMEIQTHTPIRAVDLAGQFSPQILVFLTAVTILIIAPMLQSALATPRTARATVLLGKTTYPLYLIHQTAGTILIGTLLNLGVSGLNAILLSGSAAIGVAMLIAAYVEPAVRALIAHLLFDHRRRCVSGASYTSRVA